MKGQCNYFEGSFEETFIVGAVRITYSEGRHRPFVNLKIDTWDE